MDKTTFRIIVVKICILAFLCHSIILPNTYAARLPIVNGDVDQWGAILNDLLNVTLTENGSIKPSVNASISLWNISGNIIYPRDLTSSVGIGTTLPTEILTVIGNVNISGYLNISGDLIINNKFNVSAINGNVNMVGTLDAGNLRILGSNVQIESNAFKRANITEFLGVDNASLLKVGNISNILKDTFRISNYSLEYSSTGFNLVNFTSVYDTRNDRYGNSNFTSQLSNVNASISLWNVSGNNIFLREISGNVGINTTSPSQTLTVQGTLNVTGNSVFGGVVNATTFGLGIETVNASCSTALCTTTATCSGGKNILLGFKADNSLLCVLGPSNCNGFCVSGINSCSSTATISSASVIAICIR